MIAYLHRKEQRAQQVKIIKSHIRRCFIISNKNNLAINEKIRDKEVRLIGEKGEQLGIMSAKEAYKIAKDAGLDT